MDLELLAVLGDDGGVEEDGVEASEELVVDLDPLDPDIVSDVGRRVGVLGGKPSERRVDELLHLLVDDRDADTLEADAKGEGRNDVHVDRFEDSLATTGDRVLPRESFGVAALNLEDAVGLGVVGKANRLRWTFGADVDRQDSIPCAVLLLLVSDVRELWFERTHRKAERDLTSDLEDVDDAFAPADDNLELLVGCCWKIPRVRHLRLCLEEVPLARRSGARILRILRTESAASCLRGNRERTAWQNVIGKSLSFRSRNGQLPFSSSSRTKMQGPSRRTSVRTRVSSRP